MTVRELRAADRPAVERLQRHLAFADPDLPAAAVEGPFLGRVALDDATDATIASSGVVGYAIALPGTRVTLSELVVAPAHRHVGHGRALVDAVATGTDAETLVVTTPVDNVAARRFYEALGFEVSDKIAGFYHDGSAALRLVRRE